MEPQLNTDVNSEQKTLKLDVRGDLIDIPSYIVSKIDFFAALAEAKSSDDFFAVFTEAKSSDVIKIDTISPKFLRYIIEYIKNQQSPSTLKTILSKEFAEEIIKENLKYLGMNNLHDRLYDPGDTIDGMQIIESFSLTTCRMRDGQLIAIDEIDFLNTLILISANLMNIDEKYTYYDYNKGKFIGNGENHKITYYDDGEKDYNIPNKYIISKNMLKFVRLAIYCQYNLAHSHIFKSYIK